MANNRIVISQVNCLIFQLTNFFTRGLQGKILLGACH